MFSFRKWIGQLATDKSLFHIQIDQPKQHAGQAIGLNVEFHGRQSEQQITQLICSLNCELTEKMPNQKPEVFNIAKQTLASNICLAARQNTQDFYLFQLPQNCPISSSYAQLKLNILVDCPDGERYQHACPLDIQQSELAQSFIDSLLYLGFVEESSWLKQSQKQNLPYIQKYKYRNQSNTRLPEKLAIIFYFESFSDYLDVYMQIQTNAIGSQLNTINNRFSLTHVDIRENARALVRFLQEQIHC